MNILEWLTWQNGSVEDVLRARRPPGSAVPVRLDWVARTRVAAEAATALHFLHTQQPEGVLHRGVKPTNILLDADNTAKLGDVGLTGLMPEAPPLVRR